MKRPRVSSVIRHAPVSFRTRFVVSRHGLRFSSLFTFRAAWIGTWNGAERLHNAPQPTPVVGLAAAYGLAGLVGCLAIALIAGRLRPHWPRAGRFGVTLSDRLTQGRPQFNLSNGLIGRQILADGRGYSHVYSTARNGSPIDMTRRPTDPLELRGPFFYLRDRSPEGTGDTSVWSLGYEPAHSAGQDYLVSEIKPSCIAIRNSVANIRAETEVTLAERECIEFWRIRLVNLEDRPRRLTFASYQELALQDHEFYSRDPDFNAMHVGTCFLAPLNAIFARNRLLRGTTGDLTLRRMSIEVGFHAVGALSKGVELAGYEDSRTRFIAEGDLRHPQGLNDGRARSLKDEGLLYSFDPVASLTLEIDLPARGSCEFVFVNGHAQDETKAAQLVAKYLGLPLPSEADIRGTFATTRLLEPILAHKAWPFAFSETGEKLSLTPETPRPWAHVLANPFGYGVVATNAGEVFSFAGNARQNALTPFRFESVPGSLPGQIIYVVDLDSGETDAATYLPFRRSDGRYDVVYERGVATFINKKETHEIELTIAVLPDANAELRCLTLRNRSQIAKRFRIVPYFEMALAESPSESLNQIETAQDTATNTLLFHNRHNDFVRGWAFAATSLDGAVTETVRARFFGAKGRDFLDPLMVETGSPDASLRDDGRRVAAFSGVIEVPAQGVAEIVVVLGQMETREQATEAAAFLSDPKAAREAVQVSRDFWDDYGSAIKIETNQPAFDRLVNHWLPYQVLVARLWGRTGPNQRSGATGFRDQLQDVLPLLFSHPDLARRQILLHAGQQFLEGDVLKWWHAAPDGRTGLGQRTRASDPHLWLPYVLLRYLAATGDQTILDEETAYLEGPPVPGNSESVVFVPRASRETGSVYEHCRRAVEHSLARMGRNGLPLLGTGDWNDGFDLAGFAGRGESVWLGFFLYDVLLGFSDLVREREGDAAAARYESAADRLEVQLEQAWLGDRYAAAIDDSGAAFTQANVLTSAWPILSGAVDFERGRKALERGLTELEKADRILLLTPPFDAQSSPYPGRIADYPPGVRENGGQYSHGASWAVDAYVRLAELAREKGDFALAAQLKARAFACWSKISPIGKMDGEALATYGLAPHQQAADIYDGAGHAGRGGWSWYTGSAARMLSAAYAILGLELKDGEIIVPEDLFEPKGELLVRAIEVRGERYEAPLRRNAKRGIPQ
jgi:cyclic beta-1,2-glucan synthetase